MTPEQYQRIDHALDEVRSYIQSDGGDVRILELRPDMVLEVELTGNCENCSMSFMTLKAGIEEVVKRHVPEIMRVENVRKGADMVSS